MLNRSFVLCLALVSTIILLTASLAAATTVPRMSTDELKSRLGDEGLMVLDVRASRDWNGSNDKIDGALRVDQRKLGQWADDRARGKTIVLYCA